MPRKHNISIMVLPKKKKKNMNVLKLTAVNFAIQAFTKGKSNSEVK